MRLQGRAALPGYEQEVMAAEPEMDSAMMMVLDCWRDLEGERPLGYGCIGMIPRSAVRSWAQDEGLDRDLFRLLWAVLQRLDVRRMEADAAKRALEAGKR